MGFMKAKFHMLKFQFTEKTRDKKILKNNNSFKAGVLIN